MSSKIDVQASKSNSEDDSSFLEKQLEIERKISNRMIDFYASRTVEQNRPLQDAIKKAAQHKPGDSANHWQTAGVKIKRHATQWQGLVQLLLESSIPNYSRLARRLVRPKLRRLATQLESSEFFDSAWYRKQNPDISDGPLTPAEHYLMFGAREGRLPSEALNTESALQSLPIWGMAQLNQAQSTADVLKSSIVLQQYDLHDSARQDALRLAQSSTQCISVIIPTYNRATTIVRAIRSALSQSLPPKEIIVADDQSTDQTLSLLADEFAAEIACGQLIILPCKKGGVCKMRNEALAHASGRIIAYLDSDNFWTSDHLLWAAAALAESQAKSVYTAANIHHLSEGWSRSEITQFDRKKLLAQNYIDLNCFVHQASLYHTQGGFDLDLNRLVDWDYIIRLTKNNPAQAVPVTTVEYFLDKTALGNISFVQSLEENAQKIQIKHRTEIRDFGILSKNAENQLNAAAKKLEVAAEHPKPPPLTKIPYFGGLELFVILPRDAEIPDDLPVSHVKPQYITLHGADRWSSAQSGAPVQQGLPKGSYWFPDLRQPLPTAHQLASLLAATELTQIDLAIASMSLERPPSIAVSCFRNQTVLRETAIESFVAGQPLKPTLIGKVLRLPQGPHPEARMLDLQTLLGSQVHFASDGQYFGLKKAPELAPLRSRNKIPPILPASASGHPRVLILAQKLAVGGVERNTVEISRQLQADHDTIYLTLEKVFPEQGSLCHQAVQCCSNTIDLAEIAHHDLYPDLLKMLQHCYQPDAVWICNGSMWLAGNAGLIRETFAQSGIVDQQVYDETAGWINHYHKASIQSFDRFIAINSKINDRFVKQLKIAPERIDQIYSAIDGDRFRGARSANPDRLALRESLDLPQDKTIFAFMGRLVEQKRPLDFLEIARRSQDCDNQHFVLVGNGVLAPDVEAFLAQHQLQNVTWIQNIPDTTQFWPAVDGYIVTSEYEGLPIALLEAISLGVPVVATDVGDIRSVVEKYQAGDIVDEIGNPDLFAQTLQEFATTLPEVTEHLWDVGDDIIDFFSAQTIAQQFSVSFAKAKSARKARGQ